MKEYIAIGISVIGGLYYLYSSKKNKNGEKYFIKYIYPNEEPKDIINLNLIKSKNSKFEEMSMESIKSKSILPKDNGEILRSISNNPNNSTFMIKTKDCVGFKKIGTNHATTFHLIIIPKHRNIRWYNDISFLDFELLEHMKYVGKCWAEKNKRYLDKINPNNSKEIQFGFHIRPKIGYLSMHMLIGPLSEAADSYRDNWISYDQVIKMIT